MTDYNMTEQEIQKFEQEYNVKLPQDYREFLLAGFGGFGFNSRICGEFYSLDQLWVDDTVSCGQLPGETKEHDLEKPIPFISIGWESQGEFELAIITDPNYYGLVGLAIDGVVLDLSDLQPFSETIKNMVLEARRRSTPEYQKWYEDMFKVDNMGLTKYQKLLIAGEPVDFRGPDLPDDFDLDRDDR